MWTASCARFPWVETGTAVRDARASVTRGLDAGSAAEAAAIVAHWEREADAFVRWFDAGEALAVSVRAGVPSTRSASPEALDRITELVDAFDAHAAETPRAWRGQEVDEARDAAALLVAATRALTAACAEQQYQQADLAYLDWAPAVDTWRRTARALYTAAADDPMSTWGIPGAGLPQAR